MEEKALTVWLNSTLGILLLWANREDTEGAWVQFKKPVLSAMPVLDIPSLSLGQKQTLITLFDKFSLEPLNPFPKMASDPVRQAIDAAVADALHLPDFSILRNLLAQEPFVCLRPLP